MEFGNLTTMINTNNSFNSFDVILGKRSSTGNINEKGNKLKVAQFTS